MAVGTSQKSVGLALVRQLKGKVRGPLAVDLFCGAGGMTEGLKDAGFNVVGAIDIDPVAVETYCKNHRKSAVWCGDIRQLDGEALLSELGLQPGQLDLLAGCPPCQGFSRMRTRNRKSVKDPRNALVDEFLRLVRSLQPKTVMMENVPRLDRYPRLADMLRELRRLGYNVDRGVVDAADYGVPQRRKRFILLASKLAGIHIPRRNWQPATVKDAIGNLGKPRLLLTRGGTPALVHRLNRWGELHALPPKRDPKVVKLISRIPKDGGSRLDLPEEDQLGCHKRLKSKLKEPGFKDVYGRMAWDEVSPTITGGCINPSKGRFLHPSEDRAITLREAALLQTFPPDYKFSLARGTYYAAAMIGNALPPMLIRRLANPIVTHIRAHDD